MPSLHFGWAVIVAVGFVGIRRSRISLVALMDPVVTLLAIVATANHYWVDAAVALCIVAGAYQVLNHDTAPIWRRSTARHQMRLARARLTGATTNSYACELTKAGSALDDVGTPKAHRRENSPLLPTT
jgi:hypothetical protein